MRARLLIYLAIGAAAVLLAAISLLEQGGPSGIPEGIPALPTPPDPRLEGAPIRWIVCKECATERRLIQLWDSPKREKEIGGLAHGSFVYVLGEETGPDGQRYVHVWASWQEGWLESSFVSASPPR